MKKNITHDNYYDEKITRDIYVQKYQMTLNSPPRGVTWLDIATSSIYRLQLY